MRFGVALLGRILGRPQTEGLLIGGALALDLDAGAAAVFLGGTIHDVAQVFAADYMILPEVGDGATFVKLLPVVLVFSILLR